MKENKTKKYENHPIRKVAMKKNYASSPLIKIPHEVTIALLDRIRYETPLMKAYAWLCKLIIFRYDTIKENANWYRDPCSMPCPNEKRFISKQLDQSDERLLKRLIYFRDMVLAYEQGEAPRELMGNIKELAYALVDLLLPLIDNDQSLQLLKRDINIFYGLVMHRASVEITRKAYVNTIVETSNAIIKDLGRISDDFRQYEKLLRGKTPRPATQADIKRLHKTVKKAAETVEKTAETVKQTAETVEKTAETTEIIDFKTNVIIAKQEDTRKAVNRIDERDKRSKHNKKQRFTYEQQDFAWNCWELARNNANLKLASGYSKVTHGQAFDYYKKDLASVGIMTLDDFCMCLRARIDRIRRNKLVKSV